MGIDILGILGTQSQQRWVALREWSGSPGNVDTDRFTTSSRLFRVSWTLTDVGRGGVLDVYVRDDKGRLVKAGVSLQLRCPRQCR